MPQDPKRVKETMKNSKDVWAGIGGQKGDKTKHHFGYQPIYHAPDSPEVEARKYSPKRDPRRTTERNESGYVSPYARRQAALRAGSPKK